jgi:hypothetical protein
MGVQNTNQALKAMADQNTLTVAQRCFNAVAERGSERVARKAGFGIFFSDVIEGKEEAINALREVGITLEALFWRKRLWGGGCFFTGYAEGYEHNVEETVLSFRMCGIEGAVSKYLKEEYNTTLYTVGRFPKTIPLRNGDVVNIHHQGTTVICLDENSDEVCNALNEAM